MSTPHVFSGRSFILCCGIICIFCGLAACKSGLDDEIENNSSADGNIASLSADSSDTSHAAVSDESQASASDGGSSAGSVGSAASHAASDAAS
ncbi:MAG: hypothetical protein LBC99_03775, partial [Spirochaetota bacterium]|nr:hypothetical protein [Spirochaetota bacterium]